ncbi:MULTISPECIES: site-specific DNA-methyltransferase [Sphingomonas]|uniref:site-specific DNA-methyltransferase n=1 Tax=Sphingomonas TaxID=13687 RepID=UPI000DEEF1C8|nr:MULTISPECIES: DNA methyltransferase [Sphingomonas]
MSKTEIIERAIKSLRPYERNARTHSKKQIKQIAQSIERFGFTNPVLISDHGEIIAGHGRVEAAKLLGWKAVPTIALSHLSETERRAYVLADNKLALNAGWDKEMLAIELQALVDLQFDIEVTGFSLAEVDFALDEASDADPDGSEGPEDAVELASGPAVSRQGDIWLLGRHRLLCGDARSADDFTALLDGKAADLVFTDPPYNVKIDGNVCGLGTVRHREFAFASGEMNRAQFINFLTQTLGNVAKVMRDGAIAFVCMDWRHMGELLAAGEEAFSELKNLVVWNKSNGGMGAFYRSKHELIFVFKQGMAEHTNSFGLGQTGRYRTNVWDYAGISSIGAARSDELAMHPTVKPVAMIADAIRDCSRRGEIVLDAFGGSGSTLIAAEKTGRSARLIEYDPLYCDTIVRRWEQFTGKCATLAGNGDTFEMSSEARLGIALSSEAA